MNKCLQSSSYKNISYFFLLVLEFSIRFGVFSLFRISFVFAVGADASAHTRFDLTQNDKNCVILLSIERSPQAGGSRS